jgi:hypothetical protein
MFFLLLFYFKMRDSIGCQFYLLLKEVFGLKLDVHVLQGSIIKGIDGMHDVSKIQSAAELKTN